MRLSLKTADTWNRKLHYYAGLYLLFFLWLFSLSGLIINHPNWPMANFWASRKQERFERPLRPPAGATDLDRARDVLAQLGLSGEIDFPAPTQEPGRLAFRASRPGRMWEIQADLDRHVATVAATTVNGWGVLHILHTFSGVRMNEPRMTRDWSVTSVWSFAMDALAVGLIGMVLGGYWMWLRSARRLLAGALAAAAGCAIAAFFMLG